MEIPEREYTILDNLDPKYKYIARDENGDLNVYETKPTKCVGKGYWDSDAFCSLNPFKQNFEWVKWTDVQAQKISDILILGELALC